LTAVFVEDVLVGDAADLVATLALAVSLGEVEDVLALGFEGMGFLPCWKSESRIHRGVSKSARRLKNIA
jgi:hypothetical protein